MSTTNKEFNARNGALIGTSSANYLQLLGGSAGNSVAINAIGSDTNISIALTPKGSGTVNIPSGTNLSINNGTANGVLYLDSNKIVTSSSALTFDGTTLVGSQVRGWDGVIAQSSGDRIAMQGLAAGNGALFTATNGAATAYAPINFNASYQVFSVSGSEGMRLDYSGNVGIGTSSPSYKLDVNGTANFGSTVTLSGGTANGVLYLNGSKAATSGSALTFDGSTFYANSNLSLSGAGTGARYMALLNETSSYAGTLNIQAGGGSAGFGGGITLYGHSHATYPGAVWIGKSSGTNTGIIFGNGGNGVGDEYMRLNSTGLGIGTSSPGTKLDVNGTIGISGIQALKSTSYGYGGYSAIQIGKPGVNNGTVALAVDVSAVSGGSFSGYNQVILPANGALFVNAAGTNFIGAIARDSSNRILLGPNTSGGITAGDVVIDASGNVGIGTTSPLAKLDSRGNILIGTNANGDNIIGFGNTSAFGGSLSGAPSSMYGNSFIVGTSSTGSGAPGYLSFWTTTNGTVYERLRIDAVGNVGIGNISPAAKLTVQPNTAYLNVTSGRIDSTNNIRLEAAGTTSTYLEYRGYLGHIWDVDVTERMRLDTNGNLLVGQTSKTTGASSVAKLGVSNGVTLTNGIYGGFIEGIGSSGTLYGYLSLGSAYNAFNVGDVGLGTSGALPLLFATNNAERMRIDSSGNVGIGTSSPSFALDVATPNARVRVAPSTTTDYALFQATNAGDTAYLGIDNSAGSLSGTAYALNIFHNGSYPVVISNGGGTNKLTYDPSGNLGLGFTPLNNNGGKSFQIGGVGGIWGRASDDVEYITNANFDGSVWTRNVAGYATRHTHAAGIYYWATAPSGAAGSTFTTGQFSTNMTLDASGNLGIGTSSPTARLDVAYNSGWGPIVTRSSTLFAGISSDSAAGGNDVIFSSGSPLRFSTMSSSSGTGYTELMRIDASGNVGIGTSSPSQKLTVATGSGSSYIRVERASQSTGQVGIQLGGGTSSTDWLMYMPASSNTLTWFGNSTNLMSLDSSGNLGLGVTPSAWNGVYRTIQIGKGASISGRSDENTWNELLSNAYRNSSAGWTYLNTDYALAYRMAAGTHQWYTAPSGTAGDAISFTQAMTLDASGNLLVGKTTPAYNASNRGLIEVNGSSSALIGLSVGGVASGYLFNSGSNLYVGAPAGQSIIFDINGEKARITSGGNVLIGTTTDGGYKLQVNGSFAATTKSFLIDHPTKEGMKLRYGSLESPYHGVRLTGEGVLINGSATIELPEYIKGLCKQEGSQVQITNIKHGKVIWVEDIEVDNNRFTVAAEVNDNKEYKFYWSFTAIRKDIDDMIVEF